MTKKVFYLIVSTLIVFSCDKPKNIALDLRQVSNIHNDSRMLHGNHLWSNNISTNELLDNPRSPYGAMHFGPHSITYMGDGVNNKHTTDIIKAVDVDTNEGIVNKWHLIGYNRYHTVTVRYIEWFIHIQRVMRLLMRDQLNWVNDPIVHKSNALNARLKAPELVEQLVDFTLSLKYHDLPSKVAEMASYFLMDTVALV